MNSPYSRYTLSFLKGTENYVRKELLEKIPNVQILKEDNEDIEFISEESELEVFRKLYSPTHIESSEGKIVRLSKKPWRKAYVPAGINPSLAYIMCMIADLKSQDILWDPFCGASVIPITALLYFDIKRAICSDISGKAIDCSKINFEAAEISEDKYKLFKSDISKVTLNKKNIDKIVSNLPFGIRVGKHDNNEKIYKDLEEKASRLLRSKGKIILLTQEKKLLRDVFRKEKWIVKIVLQVNQGGLLPEVFEIKRR